MTKRENINRRILNILCLCHIMTVQGQAQTMRDSTIIVLVCQHYKQNQVYIVFVFKDRFWSELLHILLTFLQKISFVSVKTRVITKFGHIKSNILLSLSASC